MQQQTRLFTTLLITATLLTGCAFGPAKQETDPHAAANNQGGTAAFTGDIYTSYAEATRPSAANSSVHDYVYGRYTQAGGNGSAATVAASGQKSMNACEPVAAVPTMAQPTAANGGEEHHVQLEDLEEITPSLDELPNFLANAEPAVKESYIAAAKAADIMKWIPCYCGCGISEGHQNNLDCFIKTIKPDGSVVWVDHGTRCATCQNIAKITAKLKEEGKSVTAIRQEIDEKFKEGYATPTKTPMPE